MRYLTNVVGWMAILCLLLSSCSKENKFKGEEKSSLSFGTLLNDMVQNKAALKQSIEDFPECSDAAPAYVEVALSQDGTWIVGSDSDPLRVELNPNPADFDEDGEDNYFTEESAELELEPGTYTLEYFAVYDTNDNLIWMAPRNPGSFAGLVNTALPFDIPLGAGVKKYVSVDVLCFDDREVNEYGYQFFDIEENEIIEFCVFGNFCDEAGRHFPAHFRVDAWIYSGNPEVPKGEVLETNARNQIGTNNDGDNFAEPLCIALPNGSGFDEYYVEITLLDSDAYNTEERVIRSGVISDQDVMSLFDGDTRNDYFHFREGACQASDSPLLFLDIDLELVADGMVSPVGMVTAPGDDDRLFVIDQIGKIWVIENGVKLAEPFLDVSGNMIALNSGYDERGLLGLAFHPQYMSNNRFFVYYTAPPSTGGPEEGATWNNTSRISEFTASDHNNGNLGSEKVVLEIDQPQGNHEGGTIAFGPDGYLYISLGDGGGANDVGPGHAEDWYEVNEGGNGQDIEANLHGSILRIDIDGGIPYDIPGSNPFVGKAGLDEIYAYGFRNPYRFSFDMDGAHELYVGDAGQVLYEEVSLVNLGGNYGWNVKEATSCFNAADSDSPLADCPEVDQWGNPLEDPVIEMRNHNHPAGNGTLVLVGGHVYRGDAIPDFEGQYIFASFAKAFAPTGELFIAQPSGAGLWDFQEIDLASYGDHLEHFVKGFGQDNSGEIYITATTVLGPTGTSGKLFKLVP